MEGEIIGEVAFWRDRIVSSDESNDEYVCCYVNLFRVSTKLDCANSVRSLLYDDGNPYNMCGIVYLAQLEDQSKKLY